MVLRLCPPFAEKTQLTVQNTMFWRMLGTFCFAIFSFSITYEFSIAFLGSSWNFLGKQANGFIFTSCQRHDLLTNVWMLMKKCEGKFRCQWAFLFCNLQQLFSVELEVQGTFSLFTYHILQGYIWLQLCHESPEIGPYYLVHLKFF